MNRNLWRICLKWGAVLGVALSLLEIVKMFARRVQYGNSQMMDIAMIILYILLLYWGGKEFKEHYPDRLSFSKAFLCGFLISLIGSVILCCYSLIHYNYIEKDGLQKKYEQALVKYKQALEKDTITATELTAYLDTVNVMMNAQEKAFVLPDSANAGIKPDIDKGLQRINRYYSARMNARQTDTLGNSQLVKFSTYSQQLLGQTLQAYIRQNDSASSTAYVVEIVNRTNAQLSHIDPLITRFEKNKSRVPHYDQPVTYASVNAAMQLLYGMFFAIFVALYLYRSKHPIEEEPEAPHTEGGIPIETVADEAANNEDANSEDAKKNN